MTASNFEEALRRMMLHEGGYTNHPADPGGPTNFGITIADYRKYVKPDASAADVKAMKADEAKRIYRARYWDAQRCDELPAGVDYAVFDYGVNSGIGRSGKVLRRVLNLPDNTSAVSDAVVAAARAGNAKTLVVAICGERLRFLRSLKTWDVFGKGWGRRVAEVRTAALLLADGAIPTLPAPGPAVGRGQVATAKATQPGIAGATAAAGVAAATQAHRSGARPFIVICIVAAAVALAAGGWLFWRWRLRRSQERPA